MKKLLPIIFLILNSCTDNIDFNTDLRGLALAAGHNYKPINARSIPSSESKVVFLGKLLFFAKSLSGEKDVACVSCHHPMLGGADALALPIGVGANNPDTLGPGRIHSSGKVNVPRNSPTVFNMAIYDESIFFDGRIASIGRTEFANGNDGQGIKTPDSQGQIDPKANSTLAAAQARFPVTSREEMLGPNLETTSPDPIVNNPLIRQHLAGRLGNYGAGVGELTTNNWLTYFQQAFPEQNSQDAQVLITFENMAFAIAEYERSLTFMNTPFLRFLNGDDAAISEDAKQGGLQFFQNAREGGADCGRCHSGSLFSDEKFHILAAPQLGHGKENGVNNREDFGRYNITGREEDKYAFRTPSLLNITVTGPYMHSGAYSTLRETIVHHLNPRSSITNYNFTGLDSSLDSDDAEANTYRALNHLEAMQAQNRTTFENSFLSETELLQVIEFLKTLTDPCVQSRECMRPWLVSNNDPDPDGTQLKALDGNGSPL